ncbi:MAG: methylated-DNA--[protein]-cysteine S-methyltransferase [Comamonas sp.]
MTLAATPISPPLSPLQPALCFRLRRLDSPIGTLWLATDAASRVRALEFDDDGLARLRRLLARHHRHHTLAEDAHSGTAAAQALARYFDGDLQALEALDVAAPGSPLQEKVWRALRTIPAGQVTTYGDLARRIGVGDADPAPDAAVDADAEWRAFQAFKKAGRLARAVGRANALNPVALIVPCHRVIGASGKLTGYAGGLPRKQWLLAHERAVIDPARRRLEGF